MKICRVQQEQCMITKQEIQLEKAAAKLKNQVKDTEL